MPKTIVLVGDVPFTNGDTFVVGRNSSCDYRLSYPSISRRHVKFRIDKEGRISVRDLDSLNGTFVNGQQVSSTDITHPDSDDIRLCGSYKLNLVRLDVSQEEAAEGVTQKYALVYIVK